MWPVRSLWCVAALAAVSTAAAQLNRGEPKEFQGVRVVQKLQAQVPLDCQFVDDRGAVVRLGDYFHKGKPVVLTLNYYGCPMLCGLQLNGLVDALKKMELTPGKDFELVTISFDPLEQPRLAKAKKANYIRALGKPAAANGWHFLTGQKDQIHRLTEAVGFYYRWDEKLQQWKHKATTIICTPEGRISRYLGGVAFDPKTLRLSLVEASNGKIGSLWDQVFLTCCQFSVQDGKYTANVMAIMRLGGTLTLLILGTTILVLWRREVRRRRREAARQAPVAG